MKNTAAIAERHSTPLGTTTSPRPPHRSVLWVPGAEIDTDARLSERGRGEAPSRGRIVHSPGWRIVK